MNANKMEIQDKEFIIYCARRTSLHNLSVFLHYVVDGEQQRAVVNLSRDDPHPLYSFAVQMALGRVQYCRRCIISGILINSIRNSRQGTPSLSTLIIAKEFRFLENKDEFEILPIISSDDDEHEDMDPSTDKVRSLCCKYVVTHIKYKIVVTASILILSVASHSRSATQNARVHEGNSSRTQNTTRP